MPPHSIGTGTISFGLVSIPIRLYPATSPAGDGMTGGRHRNITSSVSITIGSVISSM